MKAYVHMKLILDVYCGFILNYLAVKAILISFNWLMDKQIIVYPCRGLTLSNKREQVTNTRSNVDESQMNCAKKTDSKDYILYDFICMIFWKRKNYRNTKNRSVVVMDWGQGRIDSKGT